MKYVMTAVVALFVGLLLGVLPSRIGTRALEDRILELEARPCEQRRVGQEFATMFAGRPPLVPDRRAVEPDVVEVDEVPEEEPLLEETTDELVEDEEPDQMELPSEDQIALAKEALELRRTQAREALIQNAGVDDEQLAVIDQAYATMNRALEEKANDAVELLGEGEEPSRRDMMLFAEDLLGVMNQAEEDVRAELDGAQLDALDDSAIDPFSHVDPEILDIFAELDR